MTNRLANESSPYLLQHAENPVDWYGWSAEPLARAKTEDKPIFLSIGYSACHWCHVMEHESFENKAIAQLLNESFISIKVDREERPDIDQIYMQAVMALQGQGGWPLNVFLTPEQEVFFGGTYWPPQPRHGMPSFDHVLKSVLNAFHTNREQVNRQSKQITHLLQGTLKSDSPASGEISASLIGAAEAELHRQFDATWGGFGGAPKFPHAMDLNLLLLRYQARTAQRKQEDQTAVNGLSPPILLEVVETTLKRMAYGGIFDHLGGGFARYSVDARWLVPHFEKMLYDNALLAGVYLHAHRATGDAFYKRFCEKTLNYLLAYMLDHEGGFHSAEDADSEGVEGKFYVWTSDEVKQLLGDEIGGRFCLLYDVTPHGNFEGQNILNLPKSFDQVAADLKIEKSQLLAEMRTARTKLLQVRDQRERPGKDDKVLVSWNALAIDAFAQAAIEFDSEQYLKAAQNAANFVWENMRDSDGRLLHTWRGTAKLNAYLDDYAYLVNALVSLFQADADQHWVDRAVELAELLVARFWDKNDGGFFFTSDDHEHLIARSKDYQDASVPSGNAMAALALIRLGRLIGRQSFIEMAESTIKSALPLIHRAPMAAGQMLIAAHVLLAPSRELVLCLPGKMEDVDLSSLIRKQSGLTACVIRVVEDSDEYVSPHLASVLQGKNTHDRAPTLYVCQNFTCESPIIGDQTIKEWLQANS